MACFDPKMSSNDLFLAQKLDFANSQFSTKKIFIKIISDKTVFSNADIVLNMCTLTGAQGVTTGHVHSSVMTNREEYEAKLVRAGLDSGDPCYPIIYAPELLMPQKLKRGFTDSGVCSRLLKRGIRPLFVHAGFIFVKKRK